MTITIVSRVEMLSVLHHSREPCSAPTAPNLQRVTKSTSESQLTKWRLSIDGHEPKCTRTSWPGESTSQVDFWPTSIAIDSRSLTGCSIYVVHRICFSVSVHLPISDAFPMKNAYLRKRFFILFYFIIFYLQVQL